MQLSLEGSAAWGVNIRVGDIQVLCRSTARRTIAVRHAACELREANYCPARKTETRVGISRLLSTMLSTVGCAVLTGFPIATCNHDQSKPNRAFRNCATRSTQLPGRQDPCKARHATGFGPLHWPVISFLVTMHPGTAIAPSHKQIHYRSHLLFAFQPFIFITSKAFGQTQSPVLTRRVIYCQFWSLAVQYSPLMPLSRHSRRIVSKV